MVSNCSGVVARGRLRRVALCVVLLLLAAAAPSAPAAVASPPSPRLLPAAAPAAAAAAAPSLRLLAASPRVTLERHGRRVPVDLGVLVTPVGGDFELRLSRPDYDTPVAVRQVDAGTGAVLRELPADVRSDWNGLRRFLGVTFRNAEGEIVARRSFPFCPNGFERQRVDDTGPTVSRYPLSCGSGFPFTRGTVWGIDDHWASDALGGFEFGGRTMKVPDGRYSVTVRIRQPYRDLLGIPLRDARVTLAVTVEPGGGEFPAAGAGGRTSPRRRAEIADAVTPQRVVTAGAGASPQPDVPTVTAPDPATLPDLAALPAWSISLERTRRGRELLMFASTPWNAGPAPLVVEGFRRPGEDVMDAYQYFHAADGSVAGRAPVGTMAYHDSRGHHHWHFLQFAAFALLDRTQANVVRSRKQAFCIVPTDAVDLSVDGADWTGANGGLFTSCGGPRSIWVRETLPAGHGDTYFQSVAGQSFDVTDLPNGRYFLRVRVDPQRRLHQRTRANDTELRVVRLRGRPGSRRVVVAPWHGIDA